MYIKVARRIIWLWERKRPYFFRQRLHYLPSLSCSGSNQKASINILCTPDTLAEAAYSAWSWCYHLGSSFAIRIVVDGPLDQHSVDKIRTLVYGIRVCNAFDLIDSDLLEFSGLGPFGCNHPMGRKLLLSLSLQRRENHIYCDNDVLLFNYPDDIIDALMRGLPAYNQETTAPCYSKEIINRAADLGIDYCDALNGGLLYIPKDTLNISLANELSLAKVGNKNCWFDEQTIFAVLMNEAKAHGLSKQRYVVSSQRQFWPEEDIDYSVVHTRHFTSPTRHLMYAKGYPVLFRFPFKGYDESG